MDPVILTVVGLLLTTGAPIPVTGRVTLGGPAGSSITITAGAAVCTGPITAGVTLLACDDGRQAALLIRIRGSKGTADGTLGGELPLHLTVG